MLNQSNICTDQDKFICKSHCHQSVESYILANQTEICNSILDGYFVNNNVPLDIWIRRRYESCEPWQSEPPYIFSFLNPLICYNPTTPTPPPTSLPPITCSCSLRYQKTSAQSPNNNPFYSVEYPGSQTTILIPRTFELCR